jgi:hypothetical protein
MSPMDFIARLSEATAQYPLVAAGVAVAGGVLSTSACPCTLPTGIGLVGYVGSRTADISVAARRRKAAVGRPAYGAALSFAVAGRRSWCSGCSPGRPAPGSRASNGIAAPAEVASGVTLLALASYFFWLTAVLR